MILKAIIILLTQTLGIITAVVFPQLPSSFSTYFDYVINYMSQGISCIQIFVDTSYAATLFGWWITLGAAVLSVELFMWIWRVVTGNMSIENVSESEDNNGNTVVTSKGIRHGRFSLRRRTYK